jgi:hypothetical protein
MRALARTAPRRIARLRRGRGQGAQPLPAPFVVGVARSGTTLLRLMLDAHPELAIPPETGFGAVLRELTAVEARPAELVEALRRLPTWPDLGFAQEDLLARLERVAPWSVADGVRTIYAAYAARHGKPRWGDKTPVHCRHMTELAALLPEARFVHILRDGRDVAASVKDLPIAPGDIDAIAEDWRDHIVDARRQAAALPHYREVRYEQLVADPAGTLRELCAYLELEFEPAMLRAHEGAAQRHMEMPERHLADGTYVTHEERNRWHGLTLQPPDPTRAGRWRTALRAEEAARFEAVAGPLLAQLGYPLGAPEAAPASVSP